MLMLKEKLMNKDKEKSIQQLRNYEKELKNNFINDFYLAYVFEELDYNYLIENRFYQSVSTFFYIISNINPKIKHKSDGIYCNSFFIIFHRVPKNRKKEHYFNQSFHSFSDLHSSISKY